jgi:uncharacterized membrane protein YphA (DoxX/SURF4 family)
MAAGHLVVARFLAAAFFSVLFLQSGLSKVLDWKGHRAYFEEYFARTPLWRVSGVLLFVLMVMETLTGVVSAAGAVDVVVSGESPLAFVGEALAGVTLLCLFFGQRVARDSAGSARLVPYFLAAVGAVLIESS